MDEIFIHSTELVLFAWATLHVLIYALAGGVIMGLLDLIARIRKTQVSARQYWLALGVSFLVGVFVEWQSGYHLIEELKRDKSSLSSDKDRLQEQITDLRQIQRDNETKLQSLQSKIEQQEAKLHKSSSFPTGSGKANGQSSSWRRLTDADKTKMSLILSSNVNGYTIEIFRTPRPDCMDLADDFYNLFSALQWRLPHKPQPPGEFELEPGIRVASLPNLKEQSGAVFLTQAISSAGLPVIYEKRGGMINDATIHLYIGVKPER